MLYKLVSEVDGVPIVETFNPDNLVPAMEVRGYAFTGSNKGRGQRAELQGQPRFRGVAGPMWEGLKDGVPVIRYETQAIYQALST